MRFEPDRSRRVNHAALTPPALCEPHVQTSPVSALWRTAILACRLGRRFCLRQRSPPATRALPQRALHALGTASSVAACGSIRFDAADAWLLA